MSERHLSEISPSGNGIVHMFTVSIFLIFIFGVPTFGQQMGQLTAYTDSWIGDDGTMYSSGVTADSSNSYGHTYSTRTTLTSPSGRTSSSGVYSDNSYNAYASAETSLSGDYDNNLDPGDYLMETDHGYYCPIAQRQISWSEFLTVKKGASVTCLTLYGISAGGDCIYQKINPCDITCPRDEIRIAQTDMPNHICVRYAQDIRYWTANPSGAGPVCITTSLTRFSDTPCYQCFDIVQQ